MSGVHSKESLTKPLLFHSSEYKKKLGGLRKRDRERKRRPPSGQSNTLARRLCFLTVMEKKPKTNQKQIQQNKKTPHFFKRKKIKMGPRTHRRPRPVSMLKVTVAKHETELNSPTSSWPKKNRSQSYGTASRLSESRVLWF